MKERPVAGAVLALFSVGGIYLAFLVSRPARLQRGLISFDGNYLRIRRMNEEKILEVSSIRKIVMNNDLGLFEILGEGDKVLADVPEGFTNQDKIFGEVGLPIKAQQGASSNADKPHS